MSFNMFYILLNKTVGTKKVKKCLGVKKTNIDVQPGSFLRLNDMFVNSKAVSLYILEMMDEDNVEVLCLESAIKEVTGDLFSLLINTPTCEERLRVVQNDEWLTEGQELKEGDYVDVYDEKLNRHLVGLLRYKGGVSENPGIHFGVQYMYNEGQGQCDGTFKDKRYFICPPLSAVFVGIHKIRRHYGALPNEQLEGATGPVQNCNKNCILTNGLKIGDRVVWMSDNDPESGSVKWIGSLPDRPCDDITVGVEFDNPVGSGTGKYHEQRLFDAKKQHASFVPIVGLMKEEEFYPPTQSGTQQNIEKISGIKPSEITLLPRSGCAEPGVQVSNVDPSAPPLDQEQPPPPSYESVMKT